MKGKVLAVQSLPGNDRKPGAVVPAFWALPNSHARYRASVRRRTRSADSSALAVVLAGLIPA
jgi:hypothetical protein